MRSWLLRLGTWLLVRLGLLRGRWRRGRVTIDARSLYYNPFTPRSWRYGLYSPPGLRDDQSAPLIIVLHGCKQRALGFAQAGGWVHFAERNRVRLLCPNQRRLANPWRCWNWFHPLAQRGQGELLAVLRMIDDCAERVRVEPTAVAAAGVSAGGAMAALLAFHHPERVRAAVAFAAPPLLGGFGGLHLRDLLQRGLPVAPESALGSVRGACAPLAVIHGAADDTVHPRCAEQLVAQALASCRRGGLSPQLVSSDDAEPAGIARTDHSVDGRVRVRRIDIDGLGHVWSGGSGGHPYCVAGGPPLTELCERFLRDAGVLGGTGPPSAGAPRPSREPERAAAIAADKEAAPGDRAS